MRRTVSIGALLLFAVACESAPPPSPLPTYECTAELRCTTAQACVRHTSLSMAEEDRFACEPANGCATGLADYCDGDASGVTCNPAAVMTDVDGGSAAMPPRAVCSYP